MKCQICKNERLVFYCKTINGTHFIACVKCAVACGLHLIEEVKLEKEVKGEGMEADSSREGQGMSEMWDKWD